VAFLGIDIGTSGVRAAVFDGAGRKLAQADEGCAATMLPGGVVEADAEGWWEATSRACRALEGHTPLKAIEAVGVVGQAPTAVLVDADHRVVRPAIPWLDVRAGEEAVALAEALGPEAEARSGNRLHPYFLGPKIAWLAQHDPGSLARAACILQSHSFVVLRLTGALSCDPSTAMLCAPLFDARALSWWPDGVRAAGARVDLLPGVVRSREVVGVVTGTAAERTGIRAGVPVVAGGGDFAASALGAGVLGEGEACLMLGTAGNLLMPMRAPRFDTRLIQSHHLASDRWLALGGTLCGAALEWFRRACAPGVDWDLLEREAAEVEAGSSGVVMLPYLQGERTPIWDEKARGALFGLDVAHGRGHIFRALLEGIALGFRHSLSIAQELGVSFGEVVACNGAGRSALLRQSIADALELPLTWSPGGDGTVAGAAMLGALGVGALSGEDELRAWARDGKRVERHLPDPRSGAKLREIFARRASLYEALRSHR
jgi:xylulokinase